MAAIQRGTELKIGYGTYTYASAVPEELTVSKPNGNVEVLRDADGATMTKVFMDGATRVSGTFVLESAYGDDPPAEGDTITIGTFIGCVESAEMRHTAGATKLSVAAIKEDSMTYT